MLQGTEEDVNKGFPGWGTMDITLTDSTLRGEEGGGGVRAGYVCET
jgi:hypothetical protein